MTEGAAIKYTLQGFEKVEKYFSSLNEICSKDLFTHIGNLVENQTRLRFETQGPDPSGKPWRKWSEKYAKTREGDKRLLQDTGMLLKSITKIASEKDVIVGSNLTYAGSHQYGDPSRRIPARPYLGLSSKDRDQLSVSIERWIQEKMKV